MTNFVISGVLYDTDGTTPVTSATVRARNETTNEIQTATTNGLGEYVFDCANFASGFTVGDNISLYTIYSNYESSETVTTTSSYGTSQNLTLSIVTDASNIYYCTVQDVWDALDGVDSSEISAARLIKIIQRSEGIIDSRTGSYFRPVTYTNEVYDLNQNNSHMSPEQLTYVPHDQRVDYWGVPYNDRVTVKHPPIISITSLQRNTGTKTGTDNWESLTQQTGSGGDYVIADSDVGSIDFLQNKPYFGKRAWRITYVSGTSTVPKTVERLAVLLSIREIVSTKMANNQFSMMDNINIGEISITKNIGQSVSYMKGLKEEIDDLWEEVGNFVTSTI